MSKLVKSVSIFILFMSLGNNVEAQIMGTTKLLSNSFFCKKYSCKFVKSELNGTETIWSYYLSSRFSLDVTRNNFTGKDILLYANLIFKMSELKSSDINLINEFLYTLSGLKVSDNKIKSCGQTFSIKTLYSFEQNGLFIAACQRLDSQQVTVGIGAQEGD